METAAAHFAEQVASGEDPALGALAPGAVAFVHGMVKVGPGAWLLGKGQPVAFAGARPQMGGLRGWFVPDRGALVTAQSEAPLFCAAGERPFLTRLDCPVEVSVVSHKLLVAPLAARVGAALQRLIPMSLRLALCVTRVRGLWAVAATRARTAHLYLREGETLTARREAVVAWSTQPPTGFVPKLRLRDILLPSARMQSLMVSFYGPGNVWIEGA